MSTELNLEYYQLLFLKYMRILDSNTNRKAKKIKRGFTNKYHGKVLEYVDALNLLNEFKVNLENELKLVIQKKSIH